MLPNPRYYRISAAWGRQYFNISEPRWIGAARAGVRQAGEKLLLDQLHERMETCGGLANRMQGKPGSRARRQMCGEGRGGTQNRGRRDHTAQGKVPDAQGGGGRQAQTHLETETLTSPLVTKCTRPPYAKET